MCASFAVCESVCVCVCLCLFVFVFVWLFTLIGANTTCKLVPCTTDEIKEVLQPLNNPAANLNELKTLLNVKQMCNNLFDDFQFVDFYIG